MGIRHAGLLAAARLPDKPVLAVKTIDANEIIQGLYQGSAPPTGFSVNRAGFGALVLGAKEYQPRSSSFPGVVVHRAPLGDHRRPLSRAEWQRIEKATHFVVSQLREGRPVLVTCVMGLNRSGLINACVVAILSGEDGASAVDLIRSQRHGALFNTSFARQVAAAFPAVG